MYGIQIHKSTLLIKNSTNAISILYTGSHKSFEILCGKFLKRILSYLYCINSKQINMCDSDTQKHVSHEKWLK